MNIDTLLFEIVSVSFSFIFSLIILATWVRVGQNWIFIVGVSLGANLLISFIILVLGVEAGQAHVFIVRVSVSVIGCMTFCSLYPLWKKTKELNENINSAIKELPKNRDEFSKKYEDINEIFSSQKYNVFNHLWKEFTEQLIKSKPTEKELSVQNSIRPEKFFVLEYLLKKKDINSKLLESMPGILVGLGVLGTFIGLSVSLLFAFPYLIEEDANIENAIKILISGSSVAFFTSVVGLFCSLLFNLESDKEISLLQSSLNKFNFRLEECLKFVTEEHLLVKHLEELQQQNRHLDSMDESIACKIGDIFEQMEKSITESLSKENQDILGKFLSDLVNQMNQGMGDFSNKQRENLDKTLNTLHESIPHLISSLKNSLKENEQETKKTIDNLHNISQDNQKQINQSLVETIQVIKSEFNSIAQNMKEGMNDAISNSSGELKEVISNLGGMNEKLLKQNNSVQEVYQNQLKENEKETKKTIDNLHNISQDNQKQINQSLIETIQAIKSEFSSIVQNMKAGMNDTISSSLGELKEIISNLGGMNEKLLQQSHSNQVAYQDQLNETAMKFHSFTEKLEKELYEINNVTTKNIKEALHDFHQAVKQQEQIVENNSSTLDSLKDLTESLKSFPQALSEITIKFPELIKQIDDSNKELQTIWSNYEKRFKDVDESAEKTFIKIKEGLGNVAKESSDYIQNIMKQTNQVSSSFAQAVEALNDSIEDLNDKE